MGAVLCHSSPPMSRWSNSRAFASGLACLRAGEGSRFPPQSINDEERECRSSTYPLPPFC